MKINVLVLVFSGLMTTSLFASESIHSQSIPVAPSLQSRAVQVHADHNHSPSDAQTGHFCGTDFESAEALASLAAYQLARDNGVYPILRKGGSPPDIGDAQTFNVSEATWIPLEFQLVDTTSLYNLWVEVAELSNGNVLPGEITQLRSAIMESTPSRSIDPSKGIFENNHDLFGLPPNIDGDGLVDILMYDIGRGSGSIIGYVAPADLLLDPPEGVGNSRDILYLDSNEGTRNFTTLTAVAAHEYTHLIHQAFGSDQTFISEGYAEYAIILNGNFWRNIDYFGSIFEVSQPLFGWRAGGGPGARDYQRAGLFFNYIAEQVGHEAIGEMLQDQVKKGSGGIDSVLAMHGSSISDILLDFHTANFLNDQSLDTRFGYSQPERSAHHAFLTSPPVNGEISNSGGEGGFTLNFAESINAGSVHYLRVQSVSDFVYRYDTPSPIPVFLPGKRLRNRARVLLLHHDGTQTTAEIDPSDEQRTFTGEFDSMTFIFVHEDPAIAIGDQSSLEAGWIPLSIATDIDDELVLPSVTGLRGNYPNPFATRTEIPLSLARSERVQLEVFDILGRSKGMIANGTFSAGEYSFSLDASGWPVGTYFLRLSIAGTVRTRTITLAR